MQPSVAAAPESQPPGRRARSPILLRRALRTPTTATVAGVAVLAFAARFLIVYRGAGLHGLQGYDDGVYYSGAASLVFGRLPYRDFVFLHPPGVLLALAPFAELGRLTSDPTGLAVARMAFMAVGGLNAALVTLLASRVGRVAALVAGSFYALWLPSMLAERTTLLEPLMTTGVLSGLLLLRPAKGRASGRRQLLAGAAFGLAVCVKLWGAVPLAVVVVTLLVRRAPRVAVRVTAGTAAAAVVVCGPFLVAAGDQMLQMVLLDQAGRPRNRGSLLLRLSDITSVVRHLPGNQPSAITVATVLAVGVMVAATVLSLRGRGSRLWGVLLLAHVAVLLITPTYYGHYASFAGVPLALVVGAASATLVRRQPTGRRPLVVVAAVLAVIGLVGADSAAARFGIRYPAARLAAGVPSDGCVVADDNTALVELDVLSRDLRAGCRLEPDVTGVFYHLTATRSGPDRPAEREEDPQWQATLLAYLTSGSATAMVWGTGNGFTEEAESALRSLPTLSARRRFVILGR